MSDRRFFDTNILVYSRDLSEPVKHEIAFDVVREAWEDRSGRISTQVLNEFYVTVTQKLDPGLSTDEAWIDINALAAWQPVAIDMECLRTARQVQLRHDTSWWDALIIAAAYLSESRILLSEDLNHGQVYMDIEVVNPFLS
jgi:predicted nucleic acid-binding protein